MGLWFRRLILLGKEKLFIHFLLSYKNWRLGDITNFRRARG